MPTSYARQSHGWVHSRSGKKRRGRPGPSLPASVFRPGPLCARPRLCFQTVAGPAAAQMPRPGSRSGQSAPSEPPSSQCSEPACTGSSLTLMLLLQPGIPPVKREAKGKYDLQTRHVIGWVSQIGWVSGNCDCGTQYHSEAAPRILILVWKQLSA